MAGLITLIKGGFNTDGYYRSMNQALKRLDDTYTMLHYPYFVSEKDSFQTAQKNLTDYCISCLPGIGGKRVLEIGCGNGIQALYLMEKYGPEFLKAIDLNKANIDIARGEAERNGTSGVEFDTGDAQDLLSIEDHSFDVVVNIESAFHYPDKPAFLREIKRVLKPGGHFLIADIISDPKSGTASKRKWKEGMQLNHWPREKYETELAAAGLEILRFNDITDEVIRGFELYPQWLKKMPRSNVFRDLSLKLFYTINVRLNIRLLKRQRDYVVITGTA